MPTKRRVVVSVALVVLVALAGCTTGPFGDPAQTDSATTSTLEDLSLPESASEAAVENGTALAETHAAVLSERGYEVAVTASYPAAAEARNVTYVVRRDAETGHLYQRSVQGSGDGERRVFAYANETGTYEKQGTDDPSYTVYSDKPSDGQAVNSVVSLTDTLVPLGNWTDPSVVAVDGQTLVEYDLSGISADTDLVDAGAVTNASGSLLIDEQGVVHHVSLNLTRDRAGVPPQVNFEYRVDALGGVSVEPPAWVRTAVAEQDDSPQIANRVSVVAATGDVVDGRVETVTLTVARVAGGSDIDLSKAAVQWIGPDVATTLTAADSTGPHSFAVEPVRDADESAPVLSNPDDRFGLVMNASEIGSGLEAGAEAKVTITTPYGSKTTYWVSVPETLTGESTVRL